MNYTEIEIEGMKEILRDKEEEIRKLNESLDIATQCSSKEEDGIIRLSEENRKLKERIKELELCNLNLQTWIDNKEKINKSLREELQRFKDMGDSGEE